MLSELKLLTAPPQWRVVDFISDLHLQAGEPDTFAAWRGYMQRTSADALFILGDLFEVWVGDDAADAGFEFECAKVLQATAQRLPVFFMHGNRDFLVGDSFMTFCQTTLLDDPTVLEFGGGRCLLSHGDELCLADTDYQRFRVTVRSPQWQKDFLAKPLAERKTIARQLRLQSEARKKSAVEYADVDSAAANLWLGKANAGHLIHGHTHKPADHVLENGRRRIVLSDWDLDAKPPRAEVLRLTAGPDANFSLNRIAPESA